MLRLQEGACIGKYAPPPSDVIEGKKYKKAADKKRGGGENETEKGRKLGK